MSIAAGGLAILFALFSSEATRGILDIEASIAAVLPLPSAAVQSDPSQPAVQRQLNKSSQPLAPENEAVGLRNAAMAAATPTPEEVKAALQSALQGSAPRSAGDNERSIAADAVRHLDPNEIASSITRANALIASGDIAAARLVLRRPAEAGDAHAAMTLAETYDPAILKKQNVHGVVPDVDIARSWYEKAKKSGAAEAIQRLEVLASKQH
jgi:TPR repeat protein